MIVPILILAFILRLINLNQSLWLDEAVQAITAKSSIAFIFQEITGDFHPPLYHFLMHYWVRLFGDSEISLRFPSVVFGVATVWIVYKITKLLTEREGTALAASVLMATAPFHIYYSQEARIYTLAVFLTTLSFYFFLSLLKKDKGLLPFIIFTALALLTDYYFFLIFPIYWLIFVRARKYKWLIYSFIPLFIFALWLPMFLTQIKVGMRAAKFLPEWSRMVNLSTYKAIPLTFIKFSMGRITIFDKKIYAAVSAAILIFYGLIMTKGLIKLKRTMAEWHAIILWLIFPMAISWLISFVVPNFQPFRLLLVLPAFYLLLAYGADSFVSMYRYIEMAKIVLGIIVGINIACAGIYFGNRYFWREDWRGLVRHIERQENSAAIIPSRTSDWPWRYYAKNTNNLIWIAGDVNIADENKTSEVLSTIDSQRIYFIRYLVPLFDPQETIDEELKSLDYIKIKEINFNQIPVWEYVKE